MIGDRLATARARYVAARLLIQVAMTRGGSCHAAVDHGAAPCSLPKSRKDDRGHDRQCDHGCGQRDRKHIPNLMPRLALACFCGVELFRHDLSQSEFWLRPRQSRGRRLVNATPAFSSPSFPKTTRRSRLPIRAPEGATLRAAPAGGVPISNKPRIVAVSRARAWLMVVRPARAIPQGSSSRESVASPCRVSITRCTIRTSCSTCSASAARPWSGRKSEPRRKLSPRLGMAR
jgi:hypothetical protein